MAPGRRPSGLSLGHPFREGEGNVAACGESSGHAAAVEAGAQGRPGAALPREGGARAVCAGGSEPRPVSRSARIGHEENGDGPAGDRAAATSGDAGGDARQPAAAQNQIHEEYAADDLSSDGRRVRGNFADGGRGGVARNSASLEYRSSKIENRKLK